MADWHLNRTKAAREAEVAGDAVPTRFAAALEREKLSQSDVARALGVTHQSVNEWATGRRKVPGERAIALMLVPGWAFRREDFKWKEDS